MNSGLIRQRFKDFFETKQHQIISSASMVVKDDPTLMFTNAGMNQFKDIFLGNQTPKTLRIANAQKCLRVSGKHNDLEEVGHDTYHHTMFEMLGNWSFGDYFKEEAIDWAWEFLIDWMKIEPQRLYATIFEGDAANSLDRDQEADDFWRKHLDADRILNGKKKDNFWEMGDTGPCGPCSEIHLDLRPDEDRLKIPAQDLINNDHPLVIEIWNLVFIQFNRKSDGSLEPLPEKHVDTGMGFERLCMAVQKKKSNYDTDLFQPTIQWLASATGSPYGSDTQKDIAMRVIADHLRAVAFSIADGQLPANTGAGYVIRRILRRAIRYAYTFLNLKDPFLASLTPILSDQMGEAYPEIVNQNELIKKVIQDEERNFLKTLSVGIERLEQITQSTKTSGEKIVKGEIAFELYDTYGFPVDLTQLMLSEKGLSVDLKGFDVEMQKQKTRSRKAANQEADDWIIVRSSEMSTFEGYDHLSLPVKISRYRIIKNKKQSNYQMVFDRTPFYPESGGQVGDKGRLTGYKESLQILDVIKENNLIIHLTDKLPSNPEDEFTAQVNEGKRFDTMRNHSATHLLHHVLRKVIGDHVEQKGSLVHPDYLRFDFSHFDKVTETEIDEIESNINQLIRQNIPMHEHRDVSMDEAHKMGAIALFGEKYGNQVRVIEFGESVELCGGTHVSSTGQIGLVQITYEGSIAAGIRRIEAITGRVAETRSREQAKMIHILSQLLKTKNSLDSAINELMKENSSLKKDLESYQKDQTQRLKTELIDGIEVIDGVSIICQRINLDNPALIRDLAFQLRRELDPLFLILGAVINGKPNLTIMISDSLVEEQSLDAGRIVRESAREMQGGGGGQPFFASAGGKEPNGLDKAMIKAKEAFVKPKQH